MTEYVKTHKCKNCGTDTSGQGHLCHPNKNAPVPECECCGKPADSRHVCADMIERLEYQCKQCGRVAVYGSLLCDPETIE
jgi:hypothetical protein